MSQSRRSSGQPLLALGFLLVAWLAARVAGFGDASGPIGPQPQHPAAGEGSARLEPASARSVQARLVVMATLHPRAAPPNRSIGQRPRSRSDRLAGRMPVSEARGPGAPPTPVGAQAEAAEAHREEAGQVPSAPARVFAVGQGRWSADAWLLWRAAPGSAPGGGIYGASQLGAVLRYRIDRASPYRPTFYLRGAAALAGAPEQDGALGFALRPVPRLPVSIGVEARATRTPLATRVRLGGIAVTEFAPRPLPLGFSGELYGQAGWIGGPGPVAFGDLQLRIERPIGQPEPWRLLGGGGIWAAGQTGTGRVDVGPVLDALVPLGPRGSVRLEFGWRLRVAGGAGPGSGPAVVLASSL